MQFQPHLLFLLTNVTNSFFSLFRVRSSFNSLNTVVAVASCRRTYSVDADSTKDNAILFTSEDSCLHPNDNCTIDLQSSVKIKCDVL